MTNDASRKSTVHKEYLVEMFVTQKTWQMLLLVFSSSKEYSEIILTLISQIIWIYIKSFAKGFL